MNVPLNVHICGRCVRVDDGEGCFTVGTPEPRVRVDLVLSMQLELDCFRSHRYNNCRSGQTFCLLQEVLVKLKALKSLYQ